MIDAIPSMRKNAISKSVREKAPLIGLPIMSAPTAMARIAEIRDHLRWIVPIKAHDREVFLVLKEFAARLQPRRRHGDGRAGRRSLKALQQMGEAADEEAQEKTKGFEVGYELFSINGRMLGHGEPIRVKQGERVLFHVLNASATEIRSLALPGHVFRVVALDGNPVPTQADVPVLWLGTAERISAIVEMNHPGVWVLGDLADDDRGHGMGIVIEYAGQKGKPQWTKPKPFRWDYTQFGKANAEPASPDETIEMTIVKHNAALNGFNQWTLNGEAFSMETMKPMYTVHRGAPLPAEIPQRQRRHPPAAPAPAQLRARRASAASRPRA